MRGKPFGWPQTDRDRTDLATYIVKTHDPHVLLVHLIALDSAQHTFGPGSPEALRTMQQIDGYVGEIVEAVRASGHAGTTTVAVVSDHGFLPLERQLQPNAAFKQAGLLTVERARRGDRLARLVPLERRLGLRVREAGGRSRARGGSCSRRCGRIRPTASARCGTARPWRRAARIPTRTSASMWWTASTPAPAHDVLVKAASNKGGHGFGPDRTALHSSLVMAGPAVSRRGTLGVVKMTQIAPTLAAILDVRLAADAAKPLDIASPVTTAR